MFRSVCVLIALCLLGETALAVAPEFITVQGRLTDAGGNPLPAGSKTFSFRIFDAVAGGNQMWPDAGGEVQVIPSDADGAWSGNVGVVEELGSSAFAEDNRWLQIEVEGTILPRVQLAAVPYAYRVESVDGAGGGTIFGSVSIGSGHINSGSGAFVAGTSNTVVGDYSSVTGGRFNRVHGQYSFIGGGGGFSNLDSNIVAGTQSAIVGGKGNIIAGDASVIVGGQNNFVNEDRSFLGGGEANDALGFQSVIVGGLSNIASGPRSTIVGGSNNKARGDHSVVGGGGGNAADSNAAIGIRATIPGGSRNIAAGNHSFAVGRGASALHRSAFVWADSGASSFASTGAGQFLIRASGGVGIGTNNPDRLLHVQDGSAGTVTANSNAAAVIEGDSDTWLHILSPDTTMRGILFGSPANALMGSIRFNPQDGGEEKGYEFRGRNNNILIEIDSLGNLHSRGSITAVGTCCSSDERLKRNIRSLSGGLDKVACLRGVSYEWRPDETGERIYPSGEQIGLIAQEVQKVVPQAVTEDEDGYLAVDYTRLLPLLIEGMKEQQSLIERQNERIANLEKKLEQ